jgi:ferredoxin-nitrite reductase
LARIEALGLHSAVSPLRAGLVACTGNTGCKFAASDTKRHAAELAEWLESRIAVPGPINIHLTGCPHSCAQHLIGDIGLIGTRIDPGDEGGGETVEGYDLHVGGGAGPGRAIARKIREKIPAEHVRPVVLALLQAWQQAPSGTSFQLWASAQDESALARLCASALHDR